MSVQPGSRLGPFEVLAEIGAGGMGKVYRARDTRLGRFVAIKVLPANAAADEEALARFEREARAIASLNHPHICVLHDVGREHGIDYLVMELVEGQTLAARLAAGPLPVEDALRFAIQIASALDRAHRAGIVHRDLKPGNIMVTSSGVKLLDFGLAKLQAPGAGPRGDLTRTTPLTGQGTILGTLQYMAPEQLEGREADARTDIWAFGCVLYEMLTGRRTFEGDSQATVIASILKDTPRPITELIPLAPPACDRIVRACLAKDPDERWQTARDLRRELDWVAGASGREGATAPLSGVIPGAARGPSRSSRWLPWTVAAAAASVAAVFGALWMSARPAVAPPVEIDVTVPLRSSGMTVTALSPDGRTLAYAASGTGASLHLRRLDSAIPLTLPGTEGADKPFWSPDGTSVGYFAKGGLWTVNTAGGAPRRICDSNYGVGAAWSDGAIVFSSHFGAGLSRVGFDGSAPRALTRLDAARKESVHAWPVALPGGRRFLFVSRTTPSQTSAIEVVNLDDGIRQVVTEADSLVGYSEPWLLFTRGGTIYMQHFDPTRAAVDGSPRTIIDHVDYSEAWGGGGASVSGGSLAYVAAPSRSVDANWIDGSGRALGPAFTEVNVGLIRLSPDATRVAYTKSDETQGADDVWVIDLARGTKVALTRTRADEELGAWASDAATVYFANDADGQYALLRVAADGATPPEALAGGGGLDWDAGDVSPNGRTLAAAYQDAVNGSDLWLVSVADPSRRTPWLATPATEAYPEFSPRSDWLAFTSNQSGSFDVYVRRVVGGLTTQVSVGGGGDPHWSPDGSTLYYTDLQGRIAAVPLDLARGGAPGTAHLVSAPDNLIDWDVASDGRLLLLTATSKLQASIRVRTGWKGALER